jgi:hypothetical protein
MKSKVTVEEVMAIVFKNAELYNSEYDVIEKDLKKLFNKTLTK